MLLLEGFHLHTAGVRALRARRGTRTKLVEGTLLGAHIIGYLTAVFLVFPRCRRWPSCSSTRACSGFT